MLLALVASSCGKSEPAEPDFRQPERWRDGVALKEAEDHEPAERPGAGEQA